MPGSPRKKARREAEALQAAASVDPALKDRAVLATASTDLLANVVGEMPGSLWHGGGRDVVTPVAQELHKVHRKLTIEFVQDQALLDWMDRRQTLLSIIDGDLTTSRQALSKEGEVVNLVSEPTITERLRGLELLARYSALGRKPDRDALSKPVQALAELLGIPIQDLQAMVDETPAWTMLDAPPSGLESAYGLVDPADR